MYMDDIHLFVKNEKESETLIQAVRIYSKDIRMEIGIKNIQCKNDYSIRYDQNTEKSPGELRRFAITQTSMKKRWGENSLRSKIMPSSME